MAIDTLKIAKSLQEAGFSPSQAEAVAVVVRDGSEGADVATKRDLHDVDSALRSDIAKLEASLRVEIGAVRAEMREMELRLEVKIEAVKTEVLNRMAALFLGGLAVNIIAVLGAMFAVVKLTGH